MFFLSHRNAMFIPDSSAMIVFFVSHRNAMFLPDPSARVITCIHVLFFKFDNDITPYMLNIVIIIYVRMCVFMTCVTMQKKQTSMQETVKFVCRSCTTCSTTTQHYIPPYNFNIVIIRHVEKCFSMTCVTLQQIKPPCNKLWQCSGNTV